MRTFILFFLSCCTAASWAQDSFDKYFTDKVLRLDFIFAGNSRNTIVYPAAMKEEPFWGGSRTNLIDPFDYGNFKYEVFDSAENNLIYSRGFCTLFQEWQTTAEAKTIERSFYEVTTMPFPKSKVRFVLSLRERNGNFTKLYETLIDPLDYFIRREKPLDGRSSKIYGTGSPATSVDLAFIAEGYRADEMGKFRDDVRKLTDILFKEAPFSEYRDKFNIWAVEAVSS
ncbi:MAG: peptidase M64, partial [Bacteroidales bacterium]|nr:peptidase M64 [Bacteroidales bacterium]